MINRVRHCLQCGSEIPFRSLYARSSGRPRRYCNDACKMAAYRRRILPCWRRVVPRLYRPSRKS